MKKTMTPVEQVKEFHEASGQPIRTELTTPTLKEIKFREAFKLEELIEGMEAIFDTKKSVPFGIIKYLKVAKKALETQLKQEDIDIDFKEHADSLFDLQYIVNGECLFYGYDMDKLREEGHSTNMTRFCKTEKDVEDTLKKAEEEGVEVFVERNDKADLWVVKRKDNGKVYKNANRIDPDFSKCFS